MTAAEGLSLRDAVGHWYAYLDSDRPYKISCSKHCILIDMVRAADRSTPTWNIGSSIGWLILVLFCWSALPEISHQNEEAVRHQNLGLKGSIRLQPSESQCLREICGKSELSAARVAKKTTMEKIRSGSKSWCVTSQSRRLFGPACYIIW